MNIEEHSFKHNFIIGTKLKRPLIIGLDFAQMYKLDMDWKPSGTLYLQIDGCKNSYCKEKG